MSSPGSVPTPEPPPGSAQQVMERLKTHRAMFVAQQETLAKTIEDIDIAIRILEQNPDMDLERLARSMLAVLRMAPGGVAGASRT